MNESMKMVTDQKLPEGFHWCARGEHVLPAADPDCGVNGYDVACAGPLPGPLALPCVGAKVVAFPGREARGS